MATTDALQETDQELRLENLGDRLGHVSTDRIFLFDPFRAATVNDIVDLAAAGEKHFELIDGILLRKPMSALASSIAGHLFALVLTFIKTRGIRGFLSLGDGEIRYGEAILKPDLAFTPADRLSRKDVLSEPVSKAIPTLAVEVLSPGNTADEMRRKRETYFASGTQEVWMIDPEARTLCVYNSAQEFQTFRDHEIFATSAVLPGFEMTLHDLIESALADLPEE